jgi:hypothetical protein
MLGWSEFDSICRIQQVQLDDFLSVPVYYHSGVPQGSHLDDVVEVLRIFEHVSALEYAEVLKLAK